MNDAEKLTVTVILTALSFLVPAFVLHTSPRFAGSMAGFALGSASAVLMLLLLIYPLVKYSGRLRSRITKLVSLRALLTFHVYAGLFGAFLGVLHTGHKYQSALGVALIGSMLTAVFSGIIGRYYLPYSLAELQESRSRLASLRAAYNHEALSYAHSAQPQSEVLRNELSQRATVFGIVEGIADLEYAIGSRDALKRIFMFWIVIHVVTAVVMYFLLGLHIAGEIYYGLRWLS